MEIKPGNIIFVHGNSLIDKGIEYFDKGFYSHVAIGMPSDCALESQYLVNTRIITNPYHDNITVLDLGLTDEQIDKLVHSSFKYLEDKYDIKQIFGILISDLFKNIHTNVSWNDRKKKICSELVVDVLYDIGFFNYVEYESLVNTTPNKLYTSLKNKLATQKEGA